ncbi:MAG TPA: adenylate/guanylate cyclase domain-containing protein [Actinomycetota bacterium]
MIVCPACGEENPERARFCLACGTALDQAAAAPAADVRKTVTVVFSDVTGSTAIGERLDPETLRRVMTRYFDEMRDAVQAHGGVVEKFIGDAVMAVFGIPRVHEDDAIRAVRAAAEMRSRLAALNDRLERDHGVALSVRTGVNTGEVVAGDVGAGQRLVTGDAVNVAARLEQAAAPGEILLGATSHALVRDAVDAVQLDQPLELKGKAEPVTAWRLEGVTPGVSGHARRLDSPMVGRERQRRLLEEAFDQAVSDRVCYLFTVLGSAGVGKSRLVNEFLDSESATRPARVVHGRCLSYGDGITFWPVAEAIKGAAGIGEDEPATEAVGKVRRLFGDDPEADSLASQVAGLIGLAPADAPPEDAFRAVRRAFELVASATPLVVVFDDVHWAQPAFLDLIDHLADWSRDAPILLICLARQELLEARPAWGGGKLTATTIQLEPLSDDESEALIANLLGSAGLEREAGRRIATAAEGNPLFVEEMLEMLIDDGLLVRRNSHWEPDGDLSTVAVPPTIQALLAARLERLGPDERSVMERGAVEGKVFHRGAVLELAPDPVRSGITSHLMALVRKELVRPDRPTFAGEEAFRFRHLLIRDAAYQAMPKETRAELHERFAGWLERVAGDRLPEYEEIVGYHLEQAYRYREELGPVGGAARELGRRAAAHLAAAGSRAEARGDAVATRSLLARATSVLDGGDPQRLRLQPALGRAMFEAGELEAAGELLKRAADEAERAGDRPTAAWARVNAMSVDAALGVASVTDVVEEARATAAVFEELGDEGGVASAFTVMGQFQFFLGSCADAQATLEEAARRAEAVGDSAQVFEATWWLMSALFFGPTPATEVEERLRAAEARTRGTRSAEAAYLRASCRVQMIQGRFDEARASIARWEEIERELGRAVRLSSVQGHYLAPLEMAAGRYAAAAEAARLGFEAQAAIGDRGFSATVAGVLAHALLMLGEDAEAERFARESVGRSAADDLEPKMSGNGALGVALAMQGAVAEGERYARLALDKARATDYSMNLADAFIDLARVVAIDGRRDEGLALVDEAIDVLHRKEAWALVDRAREARVAL